MTQVIQNQSRQKQSQSNCNGFAAISAPKLPNHRENAAVSDSGGVLS